MDGIIIIDYQKEFINTNSRKIVKPLTELMKQAKFGCVAETMWFNSGENNFIEELGYESCKYTDKASHLQMLFPKAHVYQRLNKYSAYSLAVDRLMRKCKTVYVCGLETDACVLATVFSLFDAGYTVRVIEDCTSTISEDLHNATKLIMLRQFGKDIFVKSKDLYEQTEGGADAC